MIYKKLMIKDVNPNLDTKAYFEFIGAVCLDAFEKPKPLMVVIPGGGYHGTSAREADPIAVRFLNLGYSALIVRYTCLDSGAKPPLYPYPQAEVMTAIKYVFDHKEELNVDMNSVNLVGFSAGGHLAGTYGYLFKDKELLKLCNAKVEEVKPTSICLSYPVTMCGEETHRPSIVTITGEIPELLEKLYVIKNMDSSYPPTMIWGTDDDQVVPSINSKAADEKLTQCNVKHVYYNYPHGPHGLATCDEFTAIDEHFLLPEATIWFSNYDKFIKSL